VNSVETVSVEIVVVLGRSSMPIHQLLRMGRGAVIELDTDQNEEVQILANNVPVATGQVMLSGEKIAVTVSKRLTKAEVLAASH
jgi:flagellar motor switch protein FliN/FliY